ncbi:MAG: NTP transferase domain-containing protein [Gemmatimonadota bacterium]|nr:MAG: NTP transferase domain-containing protein [Gemmatimonadota bacterium]
MQLTLIVLAAGIGSRYGGLKQLEPVGPSGEALLDYGIYDAARAGYERVLLVIRPELESAFREGLAGRFPGLPSLEFVHQELNDLPPGFSAPAGRGKPWGTGHAVLAARFATLDRFVVMNADDFYGATAYDVLARHLLEVAGSESLEFAAAGYTLRDTLSPHGGVSRAVCEVDDEGYLARVTELKKIGEADGVLSGFTVEGERRELTGDETVSMNLWAATPAAFPLLEREFERFLAEHGDDPDAEFYLSNSVNDLIATGEMRVRVIPTPGPWLGVTHREDKPYVEAQLRELVATGHYPEDLASGA